MAVGLMVGALIWSGCERDELDEEALAVAAEEAGPGVRGERSAHYSMQVQGTEVETEAEASVEIALLPGPDLKINLEFPWSIQFDAAPGLDLPEGILDASAMDLREERALIPVALTAREAGVREVTARANFSVCNDDRCEILRDQELVFTVEARPGAETE